MPLYLTKITTYAVVEAESEREAEEVTNTHIRDITREIYRANIDLVCLLPSREAFETAKAITKNDWDLDCLPYGGDGNTRLETLLPEA